MNIEGLNLVFQRIVNQSNITPATENKDAVDIKQLYTSFCEQKGGFTQWQHSEQCKEVALNLSNVIDASELSSNKKEELKAQLLGADFAAIMFVLGELNVFVNKEL